VPLFAHQQSIAEPVRSQSQGIALSQTVPGWRFNFDVTEQLVSVAAIPWIIRTASLPSFKKSFQLA